MFIPGLVSYDDDSQSDSEQQQASSEPTTSPGVRAELNSVVSKQKMANVRDLLLGISRAVSLSGLVSLFVAG